MNIPTQPLVRRNPTLSNLMQGAPTTGQVAVWQPPVTAPAPIPVALDGKVALVEPGTNQGGLLRLAPNPPVCQPVQAMNYQTCAAPGLNPVQNAYVNQLGIRNPAFGPAQCQQIMQPPAFNPAIGQGMGLVTIDDIRKREVASCRIPLRIRDYGSDNPDVPLIFASTNEDFPDKVTEMANKAMFIESLQDDPKKKEVVRNLYNDIIAHGQFLVTNRARNSTNGVTDLPSSEPKMQKITLANGKEVLRLTPYVDVNEAKILIEKNGDIKIKGIKNQDIESLGSRGFLDTHQNSLLFKALFWGLVALFVIMILYIIYRFFSWLFCSNSCSGCNKKRSNCSC
jgi:hypothetical protein